MVPTESLGPGGASGLYWDHFCPAGQNKKISYMTRPPRAIYPIYRPVFWVLGPPLVYQMGPWGLVGIYRPEVTEEFWDPNSGGYGLT